MYRYKIENFLIFYRYRRLCKTFFFTCLFLTCVSRLWLCRLTERQQTFGEKVIASLQISNVQVDDGGSYVCQASNMYGRDQQLVQLYVQEPPNRPNDLRVITVTSTTINVQWEHNGDQTSKYIVQHKKADGMLFFNQVLVRKRFLNI